jgi:hypothetical protein
LVASGVPITSCHAFDISDCPKRLTDGLKQEYAWSFAAMYYPKYWYEFKMRCPDLYEKNFIRSLVMMGQGVILYLNWLLVSWLFMGFVILSMIGNRLSMTFVVAYVVDFFLCGILFVRLSRLQMYDLISSSYCGHCTKKPTGERGLTRDFARVQEASV